MAKPNYAFEKRQRDLAKKKKKEEKMEERKQRKAAGGTAGDTDQPEGAGLAPEGDVTDPGDGSAGVAEIQRDDPTGPVSSGDAAR
ncbi:hypothetical protein [Azohydromonas australica]|uniref:hypothetical protein n=1 Tax=Azohydromonas australica TaxID=364039 RepID=UPI00040D6232|nr:hypothetical protein [Azohydromonas australica]